MAWMPVDNLNPAHRPRIFVILSLATLALFLLLTNYSSRPRQLSSKSPVPVAAHRRTSQRRDDRPGLLPRTKPWQKVGPKLNARHIKAVASQSQHGTGRPPVSHPVTSAKTVRPRGKPCFRLLLIIIFNLPGFYGNVAFLKSLYGKVFQHIVFYGPGPNRPKGVRRASAVDVGGYFQHQTVIEAVRDHPDYDGYLWIGDDIWLNYPQILQDMDENKIWMFPENRTNWIDKKKYKADGWSNWPKDFGLPAVRKHYGEIPKKFIERMKYAFGEPDMVIGAYADVGYVPRRFVGDFITLLRLLPDVIFEIAIPTALHLVSRKEDHDYFSSPMLLWYDGKRGHVWDFWSVNQSFLHPVKVSNSRLRDYMVDWTAKSIKLRNFRLPDRFNC